MRWEELFADLEGQAAADARAELDAEVAERTRREAARLRLVDRLRGAETAGHVVTVAVVGGAPDGGSARASERGRIGGVGPDWVLLVADGAEVLVALASVESVVGLGPEAAEPGSEGAVVAKLGLGHALRAVARDRAEVRLTTTGGSTHVGTIERVGADHLELTEHPAGEPRQRVGRRLVPFTGLATLRVVR